MGVVEVTIEGQIAQDMGGLQIAWAIRLAQKSSRDPAQRYCTIADQFCEVDRFSQGAEKGWYDYVKGSRKPVDSPDVETIIKEFSIADSIKH